jgi:hypothetical protein
MKTIWKFPLKITTEQTINVPLIAFLSIDVQYNVPCLWWLVDTDLPLKEIIIATYGTGESIPSDNYERTFLGTFQLFQGNFVGHVFLKQL